jgi:hypothetical protein
MRHYARGSGAHIVRSESFLNICSHPEGFPEKKIKILSKVMSILVRRFRLVK